jgi:hypothetical protein
MTSQRGHGAPKSGLADFGILKVSKSATADFDERAVPTLRFSILA